jgi:hypothetical protein
MRPWRDGYDSEWPAARAVQQTTRESDRGRRQISMEATKGEAEASRTLGVPPLPPSGVHASTITRVQSISRSRITAEQQTAAGGRTTGNEARAQITPHQQPVRAVCTDVSHALASLPGSLRRAGVLGFLSLAS